MGNGLGGDDRGTGMCCADGLLGLLDRIRLSVECLGVRGVVAGMAGVGRRQPRRKFGGHRLGGAEVVEDMFVRRGRFTKSGCVEKRVGVDRCHVGMGLQYVIDPLVVTAAVVDDQGGVGNGSRIGGTRLEGVRICRGTVDDRCHGRAVPGDGLCDTAPDVGRGDNCRNADSTGAAGAPVTAAGTQSHCQDDN